MARALSGACRATLDVPQRQCGTEPGSRRKRGGSFPPRVRRPCRPLIRTNGFLRSLSRARRRCAGGGRWTIRAYVNPLAPFIWFGAGIMARRRARAVTAGRLRSIFLRAVQRQRLKRHEAASLVVLSSRASRLRRAPRRKESSESRTARSACPCHAQRNFAVSFARVESHRTSRMRRSPICAADPPTTSRCATGIRRADRRYLVTRYGQFILMDPPVEPETYALWAAPFLVLLLGGVTANTFIIFRARNWLRVLKAEIRDGA